MTLNREYARRVIELKRNALDQAREEFFQAINDGAQAGMLTGEIAKVARYSRSGILKIVKRLS